MSHPLVFHGDCAAPLHYDTLQAEIDAARANGDRVVLGQIARVSRAVWNTPTGKRPTQRQADKGPFPWIYTPVSIDVERGWGIAAPGVVLTFWATGEIGADSIAGCGLRMRPAAGTRVLAFLGRDVEAASRRAPELAELYSAEGDIADTSSGRHRIPD